MASAPDQAVTQFVLSSAEGFQNNLVQKTLAKVVVRYRSRTILNDANLG